MMDPWGSRIPSVMGIDVHFCLFYQSPSGSIKINKPLFILNEPIIVFLVIVESIITLLTWMLAVKVDLGFKCVFLCQFLTLKQFVKCVVYFFCLGDRNSACSAPFLRSKSLEFNKSKCVWLQLGLILRLCAVNYTSHCAPVLKLLWLPPCC